MVSVNNIAAFRIVLTTATVLSFCWFISAAELSDAHNNCNYYQDITVPTTYYIYNNEFPYTYQGEQACSWTVMSDYRVNLTCTSFQLPWSYNCSQDRVSVEVSPSVTHQYCGDGTFSILSESNRMVVRLRAPSWTEGGRFLCEVHAIKRPQESENCECGWKNPSRIVGGNNTGVHEYPMMAGIVDSVNRNVFCGGTIISNRYVLTAAHCIQGRQIQQLGILVGDYDLSTGLDTNFTVLHRVMKAIIHPNYIQATDLNDLCILKTNQKIAFGNEVGPACLPFQHSPDTFGGDHVVLLGWGTLDYGGPPSDILQKVTLSVLTPLECSKSYNDVTPQQICTYADGKDSCQMDSGGPVLWQNPTSNRIVLIGVISAGRACAIVGGLNTKVGSYVDWIVSVTSDATYCIVE